jgi:predicted Ser/Thr protein kinase
MQQAPGGNTCPSEEDIVAFVRGSLAAQRMNPLEAHIADCSSCRQLLSALARAAGMESRTAADSVSPTLPLEPGDGETELALGTRFGRYAVVDWIGAGGMGVVYSAWDSELNRKVALKVLRNDGAARAPMHDVLLREAQAMAQLAHPNVVTVFDVGSVDGRVFIAMELVEGMTLRHWLIAEHRGQNEIITTFLAAGLGLAAAHAAGLVHRDFKPDNVLIGNDGRVRVTDFGLARPAPIQSLEARHRGIAGAGSGVSAPQAGLAGTLAYMAPERVLGRAADARADQFSFGVALYEALYGERPFAPLELAGGATASSRRALARPHSRVPLTLHQALMRALRPDPDARYPSMGDLLAALAPRPRRSRMAAGGAILVAVIAVASAGGYAIHLRRSAEQPTELVAPWTSATTPSAGSPVAGSDTLFVLETRLRARRTQYGQPITLDEIRSGDTVQDGDRLQLSVRTSKDGYLYLAFCSQHARDPRYRGLSVFPEQGGIRVVANQLTLAPARDGKIGEIVLDNQPGQETLYLILSRNELSLADAGLAGVLAAARRGREATDCGAPFQAAVARSHKGNTGQRGWNGGPREASAVPPALRGGKEHVPNPDLDKPVVEIQRGGYVEFGGAQSGVEADPDGIVVLRYELKHASAGM